MAQDFGTLGRLVVSLEANMAQFEQGLNKAEYQMQQFSSRIDTLTAGASKALLGLAATAAAAFSFDAIIGGIDKAITAAAELEKMSQKAGVSAEALSGLKSVAKESGTSLDEVVGSLQKLDKAMIQAESGSTKQAATFKALGVSMTDLKTLTPDEIMLKLAKSLDQVESGSQRVAAAQILFGKAGANLLPMLHDLAQQGEIVGKVTDQQTAMAERYERSLIALDSRKKALYNTIAQALLPTMIDVVDAFSKADSVVGKLNKTAQQLEKDDSIQNWARAGAIALALMADTALTLPKALYTSISVLFTGVQQLLTLANSLGDFMKAIGYGMTGQFGKAGELMSGAYADVSKLGTDRIKDLQSTWSGKSITERVLDQFNARDAGQKAIAATPRKKPLDLGNALGSSASAFENFLQELDRQATKLEQGLIPELTLKAQQLAAKEGKDPARASAGIAGVQKAEETRFMADYTLALKKQTDAEDFRVKLVGLSAHEQELLNIQHKAGIDLQQALAAETRKLGPLTEATQAKMAQDTQAASDKMVAAANARYEAERKWGTGAKTAIDSYIEAITNAAAQSSKLFTDAFKGMEDALVKFVKTGKLDFKSLADNIISDLIRIQVQNSIMKPLVGTSDSPGFLSQGLSSLFSFFGGGKAAGGPLDQGQWYIAGEHGPEPIWGGGAGAFAAGYGAQAAGGGITINQPLTINAPGADASTVQQIRALMPGFLAENKRIIEGVVKGAMVRGGGRITV